jgi:phosphopantothenoylcysteine synthetase/decarboxylase
MKILITSGGTKVLIDSVRHIGNMSSGTFGAKIGYEALVAGHEVTFFKAKDSKTPLGLIFNGSEGISYVIKRTLKNIWDRVRYGKRLKLKEFSDFQSYDNGLYDEIFTKYDAIILAAAVSDYDVVNKVDGKIRTKGDLTIELSPLPKLISRFQPGAEREMRRPKVLVGFKLLVNSTENELVEAAFKSLKENQLDLVVANDLSTIKAADHIIHLIKETRFQMRCGDREDPNGLARKIITEVEWIFGRKA